MVQLLYPAPHEVVGMGLLHPALVGGDARGLSFYPCEEPQGFRC